MKKKKVKGRYRDSSHISKKLDRVISTKLVKDYVKKNVRRDNLLDVEDNRRWRPDFLDYRHYLSGMTVSYRDLAENLNLPFETATRMRFENPFKAVVCVRRRRRRQELFRRKLIGKGVGVNKVRRWVEDSFISCK